jgi:hypothetical protein
MSRTLRRLRVLVALVGLALLCGLAPPPAAAQAVSGTILGFVKDATGAVVPGATVTLVNAGTGYSRSVVTDASGEYTAPLIPTGTYTISAELTGFKKASKTNVLLGVDQKVRMDLTLELGAMTEVVEIQAETPLLQTASSELGATVVEEQIKTLPLNGRNFVSLTRTVPGILRGQPGGNIDGAGSLAWRASASFSANGQRTRDNNYMLDGVDNNETWLQTVVIFPSVDALQEFKLQTSTYSAEFGRSLGGVVNLQLKSGTNEYHGSVFEFARNDAFDANNWFNNRAGREKADLSQHQFGATFGGPIIKDKTFFFADYQGLRITSGQTYLSTVPSMLMRQGNFSEVNRVIYDPLTGQPFPGNIIPESRWDPASRNIMQQLYPEPNTAGSVGATGQPINNYLITPNLERNDDQFDVKVDHRLTQNNRFFVRYSYQKTARFLPATLEHGDAGATFGAGDGNIKAQSVTFNDTHTFSPNVINEFRFGWNSIKFFMTSIDYGERLPEQMGIPGIYLGDETTSAMTQLNFQNIRNLGANSNQPLITNQNDFQIFDSVTWIKGKHTLKAGGSVTFRSREILNADNIVGNFGFNNNMTSNCAGTVAGCTVNSSTGFDVASFLLGYATTKTRNLFDAGTYTEKRPEWSLYVQDDFRVNSKLTLNLGLRWDVYQPWVEIEDRQSNFDETTGLFVVASDGATLGGVSVGRYLQTYSKGDLGPRFGFAYDVTGTGRTIVRGGVGVFWNFTPGGTSSSKAQNPPFLQSTALTAAPNTNFSNDTKMLVSAGLPPPPGVDPNRPPSGTTRSIFDVDFRDAYTTNWNLNVQQQLGTNYMLELAYAGSRGRQYLLKGDPNEAPATVGVTNSNILRPYATISPALRTLGQVQSTGILNYNAFLAKLQRRFANGFSLLTSYTFAKAMDYNSDNDGTVTVANVYNIAGYNYGPSDYDIRHTLSVAGMYELPLGREKWYGGWQVSGIVYYRTGYPFTPGQTAGILSTTVGGTGQRPNVVGDWELDDPTIDKWFEPTAFRPPADNTGTYGDAGRNIMRGPEQFNIDMSLIKYTRIGRFNLELRCEAFNVLNHPQFGQPNRTIGNAAVATIGAMLTNPACSTCGTTERNIQFAAKLTF